MKAQMEGVERCSADGSTRLHGMEMQGRAPTMLAVLKGSGRRRGGACTASGKGRRELRLRMAQSSQRAGRPHAMRGSTHGSPPEAHLAGLAVHRPAVALARGAAQRSTPLAARAGAVQVGAARGAAAPRVAVDHPGGVSAARTHGRVPGAALATGGVPLLAEPAAGHTRRGRQTQDEPWLHCLLGSCTALPAGLGSCTWLCPR